MNHIELGKWGEDFAMKILQEKGYKILGKNYYFHKWELDIISMKEDVLVIVEVKTRFTDEFGEPWQSVTKKKQKQIYKVANAYILEKDLQFNTRFDVFSIIKNDHFMRWEHIEDAFSP
ncbi:MAG: YraN family protein [Flavobacteriia bacterium]|nr:YraN family protein [Flavobacteriia bacterium]